MKGRLSNVLEALDTARKARSQAESSMASHDEPDLHRLGEAAVADIDACEAQITQLKHETYEDEDAWATMLDGQIRYLMDVIDESGAPVTDGMKIRNTDLTNEWQQRQLELTGITENYINPINRWAGSRELGFVITPGS